MSKLRLQIKSCLRHRTLLCLFVVATLLQNILPRNIAAQDRNQAILDLSQWDGSSITSLKGPWEFYWEKFLEPNQNSNSPDAMLESGRLWNETKLQTGKKIESFGYASYRLRIKGLPARTSGYEFLLRNANTNYSVIIADGRRILAKGSSGDPKALKQVKVSRFIYLPFNVESDQTIEIIVWVANTIDFDGGLWSYPELSILGQASAANQLEGLINLVSSGILLATGFYCFMLWWRRKSDKLGLYLSASALGLLLRITATTPWVKNFFPDGWHGLLHRFEYFSIPISLLCYLAFLYELYDKDKTKKTKMVFDWIGYLLAASALLLPVFYYVKGLPLFQFYLLAGILYSVVLIVKALWRKKEGAILTSIGCFLIVLGCVYDVGIAAQGLLGNSVFVTPIAAAVFFILQAQVIAKRSADAFTRAELFAEELKEKERARTAFFHNTSHELRTPLNGIIGFLNLIKDSQSGDLSAKTRDQILKTMYLAESLKTQVNTILDLAKSKRGELAIEANLIDLSDLKSGCDGLAEGLMLKHPNTSYSSQIGRNNTATEFFGDRDKVLSIVQNLLGNAFKFCRNQVQNEVNVEFSLNIDRLEIMVKDTGIGIPKSQQTRIFEEFAQVASDARRAYEGTGLGLSIVRDFTQLMGGSIEVDSSEQTGSLFRITLPNQKASRTNPSLAAKVEPLKYDTESKPMVSSALARIDPISIELHQRYRILIVDDHAFNCEVLGGILESDGYQITTASGGREALDFMRLEKPNLILLDMMMPEVSGEDVLRAMRADPALRDIPVILVTARASDEDRVFGLTLGADDYLAKPIISEEVRLRVHNMLLRLERHEQAIVLEQKDRFAQLGELFSDLSHEVKNIYQGLDVYDAMTPENVSRLLGLAQPPPTENDILQKIILNSNGGGTSRGRSELFPIPPNLLLPHMKAMRLLRSHLIGAEIEDSLLQVVWGYAKTLDHDHLIALENLMHLMRSYIQLRKSQKRGQELVMAILDFGQTHDSHVCRLKEALSCVSQLCVARMRQVRCQLELKVEDCRVKIAHSDLQQILLNLILNPIDAIESNPQTERWVIIESTASDQNLTLRVSNSGKKIDISLLPKLFARGFTTKGQKGSGIGLYTSRKLSHKHGASLTLDVLAPQTTFVLDILKPPHS